MTPGAAGGAGGRREGGGDPPADRPTLRWRESGSSSLTASACTVSSAQDEICLLFGISEDDPKQQEELCVRWKERIVLRPRIAKGLLSALRAALRRLEGAADPPAPPPAPETPALLLLPPTSDETLEAARLLYGLVCGLRTPFGFERSFKLSPMSFQGNRFLGTVSKDVLGEDAGKKLAAICRELQMPDRLLRRFHERFPDAAFVHFGFEETELSSLFKVYLEFWRGWDEELPRRASNPEPFLLHLGLKWDRSEPERSAVTRYVCHPWLSVDEIHRRLGEVYAAAAIPLAAVRAMVDAAADRTQPGRLLFLEVSEEENPRRSFDLNLYKAGLCLRELDRWAPGLARHYGTTEARFRQVYDRARSLPLGHLAGGTDRQGRDFLTVYYGMEGR